MSNLIPLNKKTLMSIEDDIAGRSNGEPSGTLFFIDFSGSMGGYVNGRTKMDEVDNVVKKLGIKSKSIVAFGSRAGQLDKDNNVVPDVKKVFSDSNLGFSTAMHEAFVYAMHHRLECDLVVVISDGDVDDANETIIQALNYGKKVEIIYIGNSNDSGELFMKELSRKTGGSSTQISTDDPQFSEKLLKNVEVLLIGDGKSNTINL